jgi:4,5-DOPA dioxygenase extradiol
MARVPVLFVSHGMPTIALNPGRTGAFWQQLGREMGRPRAIICISAHLEATRPLVTTDPYPDTIHDFAGFPQTLYEIRYPATGNPDLARHVITSLQQAGYDAAPLANRGLDHGAWVPLRSMFPQADVPVIQLSLQTAEPPAYHVTLGQTLSPLREQGVLIIGSGGATHNLSGMAGNPMDAAPADYATAFDQWLADAVATGDMEQLVDYRRQAPHAYRNHPYPAEHFLPLLVAAGAAAETPAGIGLFSRFACGVLSLAAYRWE